MDERQALERVKAELAQAWLSAPDRIAELAISKAEPAYVGQFQITSVFVEREVEPVEEPLAEQPTAPSRPFELWCVEWPPGSERAIVAKRLDVRTSYEVAGCPACSQAGETTCGVCHGSGKVHDAKANKAVRCKTCRGSGTVECPRCAGRRQLLRFKRILQRVKNASITVRLPEETKVPTGTPSGELSYEEATPAESKARVSAALRASAEELVPLGWTEILAQRFATAELPRGMHDPRPAWRRIEGRWYAGWKLQCTVRNKTRTYFVPATGAKTVGPRIRSPGKIGAVAGTLAALIISAGVFANWRGNVAREERESAERHQAEIRAKQEQQAAKEAAERQAAERHEAEERQRERRQELVESARTAVANLVASKEAKPAQRFAAFAAMTDAITPVSDDTSIKAVADASAESRKLLQRVRELDRLDAQPPKLPDVPDKPTYEKPPYTGTIYVDGEIRGNYEGDPVVQVGENFYIVKGGGICFDGCYGTPTGDTITLNIGRDGRDAVVLDNAARETYADDQNAYAKDVQDARSSYQKELVDYNAAVKARADAEARVAKDKQARAAERNQLKAKLDVEIIKMIPAISGVTAASIGTPAPASAPPGSTTIRNKP